MFLKKRKKKIDFVLDEAVVWQELAEKLARIYFGEYSYTNIIESLAVAEAIFYEHLKEEKNEEICEVGQ